MGGFFYFCVIICICQKKAVTLRAVYIYFVKQYKQYT